MSNKPIKLAVLSIVGILSLAGCSKSDDEIYSKPSNYDNAIVTLDDSTDIYHDVLSVIYDSVHSGTTASKTLDTVMYMYAESIYGSYNKITRSASDTSTTLKDAYISAKSADKSVANAFIKAHKAYWEYNEDGEHINAAGQVITDDNWTPSATELGHVISRFDTIEDRIAQAMYSKISGGTYTTKSFFSEYALLKALHEDSKKVNYTALSFDEIQAGKMIIPYTVEEEDIFLPFRDFNNVTKTALHRALYQDSINVTAINGDYSNCKYTYIEDEIIPNIYNDFLVEQYLLDQDIAAVRNSRARKINVIKIEKYTNFSNNADALVKKLVEAIYANLPSATDAHVNYDTYDVQNEQGNVIKKGTETIGREIFERYARIAKGLKDELTQEDLDVVAEMNAAASDVYNSKPATTPIGNYEYYEHTAYGDLVKDLEKIYDDAVVKPVSDPIQYDYDLLSDTKYNTYTSNGARSLLEGFEQEKISIMQKQSITKGWYIQSQAPTLDSNGTINDRLFKLSVANARLEINSDAGASALDAVDRIYKDNGTWKVRSAAVANEDKFLCSINGLYFLKFEDQSSSADWKNDIVYDDGSAYYIVQVIEAAKDSKLRNTSATSYAKTRGLDLMDEVINTVAKIVGGTGSYSSLSKSHWIEKMEILFHDQVVYDYFKSNYPDLFED